MSTRSGYKSAEEDQFMIFSNGAYLEYPAFEKASNGFVRGPKGERLGRGWEAEEAGEKACLDYINKYVEQFAQFGYEFVGVTANLNIKLAWTSRTNSWEWTGRAPGSVMILAKCYFAEHPDAFEVFTFSRISQYGSGWWQIGKTTSRYRFPDAFDDDGKLVRYWSANDFSTYTYDEGEQTSQRESLAQFVEKLTEAEKRFAIEYARVEWTHDLDEFRAKADEYLAAKDTVDQITQMLPQLAALYEELGYRVDTVSSPDGLGDRVSTLRIRTDEHTISLTASEATINCHYERDEERLVALRKLRLEDELRTSIEKHGDIRNLKETD